MSVYVGIDVHRKRSQVAVVTEDGQVQLNKNAVNGPTPGSWVSTLTRGSDRARRCTSQSSRSIGCWRASISIRPSSITSRETAGSSSEASHSRPGPLQQPSGRPCP